MKMRSSSKESPSLAIRESAINLISEGSRVEGKLIIDQVARIHGHLQGELHGTSGSTLILGESSVVEGDVHGDTIFVEGYVRGDIVATRRVVITGHGRVIGNVRSPSLRIEFGAYFEGKSLMESTGDDPSRSEKATSELSLKPV